MGFTAYPSHRFHPSLGFDEKTGTSEFVVVADEDEDGQLEASDEAWRDTPYTQEEHDAWKAKNPKGKKAKKPIAGEAKVGSKKTAKDTVKDDDDDEKKKESKGFFGRK